jgi:hypothetical protein
VGIKKSNTLAENGCSILVGLSLTLLTTRGPPAVSLANDCGPAVSLANDCGPAVSKANSFRAMEAFSNANSCRPATMTTWPTVTYGRSARGVSHTVANRGEPASHTRLPRGGNHTVARLARLAWLGWPGSAGLARLAWLGWPGSAGLARLAWLGWPGSVVTRLHTVNRACAALRAILRPPTPLQPWSPYPLPVRGFDKLTARFSNALVRTVRPCSIGQANRTQPHV